MGLYTTSIWMRKGFRVSKLLLRVALSGLEALASALPSSPHAGEARLSY